MRAITAAAGVAANLQLVRRDVVLDHLQLTQQMQQGLALHLSWATISLAQPLRSFMQNCKNSETNKCCMEVCQLISAIQRQRRPVSLVVCGVAQEPPGS